MQDRSDAQLDDRQFEIAITALGNSLVPGIDLSVFRGSGVDFSQCRQYVQGDPVRSIDWRVTARTGRLHVKEFDTLKRTPVVVVLDDSRSMRVGSGTRVKWDWAVLLAGGIMLATLRRASPAGLISGSAADEMGHWYVRPTLDRQSILRGLRSLRLQGAVQRATPRIAAGLRTLNSTPMDRALVIVLSDLHEPESIQAIKTVAGQHEVVVCRLMDPAERGIKISGVVRATEPETGRLFTFFGRPRWKLSDDAVEELRRGGVPTLGLDISTDVIPALREFLKTRHTSVGARP